MFPSHIAALILDMDGVLWKGDRPLGDLAALFARIDSLGLTVALATNNAMLTQVQYSTKLESFGARVEPTRILTSATAIAETLGRTFAPGTPVFAIGEASLLSALRETGLVPVGTAEAREAQAVVLGIDRQIDFEKMRVATLLVGAGKPFFATNPDRSFPTPDGEIPGTGAWVSVITTATGVEPVFAGKPHPRIIELALRALGSSKESTLVVGDRIETDVAAGQACGCPTALVLSGVSTREQAAVWRPRIDIVVDDVWSLLDA